MYNEELIKFPFIILSTENTKDNAVNVINEGIDSYEDK